MAALKVRISLRIYGKNGQELRKIYMIFSLSCCSPYFYINNVSDGFV